MAQSYLSAFHSFQTNLKYFASQHQTILKIPKLLICLAGFLYQASLSTTEYFKYHALPEISLIQVDRYILPSLTACFSNNEIFDYDTYGLKHNVTFNVDFNSAKSLYESGIKMREILTPTDFLTYTPKAGELIERCEIRNASSHDYHYYEREKCYEHIDVEFAISVYVCYKVYTQVYR